MVKDYFISFYLDTRRAKKNGRYPLKLQVYIKSTGERRLYTTDFEFTEDDFKNTWETTKPKNEYQEQRFKLQAFEKYANEVADEIDHFNLEAFEDIIYKNQRYNQKDVTAYYQKAIDQYKLNNQIGTAESYALSLKSLLNFSNKTKLHFHNITPQWLKNYEKYMLNERGTSTTTVGIYLRPLRAIFNSAILDKTINPDIYPFSKGKYTIPAPKSTKKALTKEQLKQLFDGVPATFEQEKAKDFWFFSYACNGMNITDIVKLQYKDINKDTLTFVRTKTEKTNRNGRPVLVILNDFCQAVIEKYGTKPKNYDSFIFPVISPAESEEENRRKTKNFIRAINQNFLKYAKNLGIDEDISTYWARHSFATNAIRSGASFELISEMLSHTSLMTTKNYFAGFETDEKRKIAGKLMEF